jgi:hypothetical protein
MAYQIFKFARERMAPYKRPRIIQFIDELPKTVSGKIKRTDLRRLEANVRADKARRKDEYFESDFQAVLGRRPSESTPDETLEAHITVFTGLALIYSNYFQ